MKKILLLFLTSFLFFDIFGLEENEIIYMKMFKVGGRPIVNSHRINTNGHEYVDLGLSVLWATCNVGAATSEEYGDYFAWGEITPKDNYSWETYKYCKGTENTLMKYCTDADYAYGVVGYVDHKVTLELEDDAAHVHLGGDWRMPTEEEYDELINKCIWNLSTKNNVNGWEVIGPNGNTIFLPATGSRGEYSTDNVSYVGNYWSSSLRPYNPSVALSKKFNSNGISSSSQYRYRGFSVRPVIPRTLYLNKISDSLFVDDECALVATCNGKEIMAEWFSSNESVAIVRAGVVKALSAGITTISAKYNGEIVECKITVNDKLAIKALYATFNTIFVGEFYKLITTFKEDTITDVTLNSLNEDIVKVNGDVMTALAVGSATITTTYKGETAFYKVNIKEQRFVDLGLSVKWATCNVGADKPEDYGDYFAWGEIEPKDEYSWSTYKYGKSESLSKYCTKKKYGKVDDKTVLELCDDVANVKMGGDWRIPTKKEQDELRKECKWTWTQKNGINGYEVTGPSGNNIFLPAAGCRDNVRDNTSNLYYLNERGIYGSSSLYSTPNFSYGLGIGANYVNWQSGSTFRYTGVSIRPVRP